MAGIKRRTREQMTEWLAVYLQGITSAPLPDHSAKSLATRLLNEIELSGWKQEE